MENTTTQNENPSFPSNYLYLSPPMQLYLLNNKKYAALLHFPFFTEATSNLEPVVKKGQRRTARLFQISISHFPYRLPFSLRI